MSDRDELPEIDMTSQADQEFMDAEVEPEEFDAVAHYERKVERYDEKGWDKSGLVPPEGYEDDEEGNQNASDDGSEASKRR